MGFGECYYRYVKKTRLLIISHPYQLGYVVDDDQIGPGVPKAKVGLIINPTELTDPAHKKGNITGNITGNIQVPGCEDTVDADMVACR